MSGGLRADVMCPVCGKRVMGVYHEWNASKDTATFEYHHVGDPEIAMLVGTAMPCVVRMPYDVGLAQMKAESVYDEADSSDV